MTNPFEGPKRPAPLQPEAYSSKETSTLAAERATVATDLARVAEQLSQLREQRDALAIDDERRALIEDVIETEEEHHADLEHWLTLMSEELSFDEQYQVYRTKLALEHNVIERLLELTMTIQHLTWQLHGLYELEARTDDPLVHTEIDRLEDHLVTLTNEQTRQQKAISQISQELKALKETVASPDET